LYSEIIQYHQNRVDSISELERRLEGTGYAVGLRVLELLAYRNRDYKRETRLMGVLQFVSTQVWKALFGKAADSLERSIDHADEFMIVDYSPITRYVTMRAAANRLGV
jgi:trafficking protein particle complex subunit 5